MYLVGVANSNENFRFKGNRTNVGRNDVRKEASSDLEEKERGGGERDHQLTVKNRTEHACTLASSCRAAPRRAATRGEDTCFLYYETSSDQRRRTGAGL